MSGMMQEACLERLAWCNPPVCYNSSDNLSKKHDLREDADLQVEHDFLQEDEEQYQNLKSA